MKVFFIGSINESDPKDEIKLFSEVCEELGYFFLSNGWEVILNSDTNYTADQYIFKGMKKYCEEGKPGKLILHSIYDNNKEGYERPFKNEEIPTLVIDPVRYPMEYEYREGNRTSRKGYKDYIWVAAHARSIDLADVVVPIRGHEHTRRACYLANAMKTPVAPVPNLGGSSYLFHLTQIDENQKSIFINLGLSDRKGDWKLIRNDGRSAENFVEYVKVCVERYRRYPKCFLSYSHENKNHADQLELLLLRAKFDINDIKRDDKDLKPGDKYEKLEDLIKDSDCFLALVSHSYRGSKSCQKEWKYVHGLPKKTRPTVIVLKVGSDKAITKLMEKMLWYNAQTDLEKKDVVEQIKNNL